MHKDMPQIWVCCWGCAQNPVTSGDSAIVSRHVTAINAASSLIVVLLCTTGFKVQLLDLIDFIGGFGFTVLV